MIDLDDVADVVASAIREATAPLFERLKSTDTVILSYETVMAEQAARIAELEKREIPVLDDALRDSVNQVGEILREMRLVKERADATDAKLQAVEERPAPEVVTAEQVGEMVAKAVSELPPPEPGKKGDDCDMEAVARMVAERVDEAIGKIPPAKDGIGLCDALRGKDGNLILTMSDGSIRDLGPIDGKDAEPFTLDDFDIEPLDERSIRMKFTHANECHSFDLEFPVPVYRGVWQSDGEYTRGDMVTWGGSMWHADEPEKGMKPDVGQWSQAVKKGRDGRPSDIPGMKILIRQVLAEEGVN